MNPHITKAALHLTDVLRDAIRHTAANNALVIFDTQSDLANILTDAYRRAIPNATFVNFDETTAAGILQMFERLQPKDLVVLVQSTNFRLNEFRIRIELFKRGLKTIEHTHLNRMIPEQYDTYIDALAYDSAYYHAFGLALKAKLDAAQNIVVECNGTKLVYESPMEDTKLNIGDYTSMKNVGGTFPIGEVFSEARDLRKVNGEALVFAFAGDDHIVKTYDPFPIQIREGVVESPDGPEEFQHILKMIREDEEGLVREFGLGLNPAMGKHRLVNDITAFERQKGLHLSLGEKHSIYAKPDIKRKEGRYHVDVFIDVERITINNETIYEGGEFLLSDLSS